MGWIWPELVRASWAGPRRRARRRAVKWPPDRNPRVKIRSGRFKNRPLITDPMAPAPSSSSSHKGRAENPSNRGGSRPAHLELPQDDGVVGGGCGELGGVEEGLRSRRRASGRRERRGRLARVRRGLSCSGEPAHRRGCQRGLPRGGEQDDTE